MIEGTCHCGAVRWTYRGEPSHLTACNCSLCRRTMMLVAHATTTDVRVEEPTVAYVQGDRSLALHHCPTCGVTTHWVPLIPAGEEGHDRVAVNMRLAEPEAIAHLRVRRFDGAETWEFLD